MNYNILILCRQGPEKRKEGDLYVSGGNESPIRGKNSRTPPTPELLPSVIIITGMEV